MRRLSFRFRSVARDVKSDVSRLQGVLNVIRSVVSSVDAEITGLSRRQAAAREQANVLIGAESGIYFTREDAEEELLAEAERQLMVATKRLANLQFQKRRLLDADVIVTQLITECRRATF